MVTSLEASTSKDGDRVWRRQEPLSPAENPRRFHAFLSSRISTLGRLRQDLYNGLLARGILVWVSEIERPDLKDRPLSEVAAACLDQVLDAAALVCLVEGSYGSTESDELGDLSVLELEVALAALMGKRIFAFRMNPDASEPRMSGLVRSLENVKGVEVRDVSQDEVVEALAGLLRRDAALPGRPRRGTLRTLAERFDPARSTTELALDRPWRGDSLFPTVRPLSGRAPDHARVNELLSRAEAAADLRNRLLLLWAVLRHLVSTPWRSSNDLEVLVGWERLLAGWDQATAWLGQHGESFLSRLAAQRERAELAERLAVVRGGGSVRQEGDSSGASASLLYSLAKREKSVWAKRRLMRRALRSINSAIEGQIGDPCSTTLVRAAIHLQLLHPRAALRDAMTALSVREHGPDTAARIGEAEGHVAWALAANLRPRQGLDYATRSVQRLRTVPPTGFAIRAMRTLGVLQATNLRFAEALATLAEATVLARDQKSFDQVGQLRKWSRRVAFAAWLIPFDRSGTDRK